MRMEVPGRREFAPNPVGNRPYFHELEFLRTTQWCFLWTV